MGTSTDAKLYYGYAPEWGPNEGRPWDDREDEDREAWVASFVGKKSGIDVIHHCSGHYMMYGLAATASELTARRGYPVKVMISQDTSAYDALLDAFIEKAGLDKDTLGERGWWLTSYWG